MNNKELLTGRASFSRASGDLTAVQRSGNVVYCDSVDETRSNPWQFFGEFSCGACKLKEVFVQVDRFFTAVGYYMHIYLCIPSRLRLPWRKFDLRLKVLNRFLKLLKVNWLPVLTDLERLLVEHSSSTGNLETLLGGKDFGADSMVPSKESQTD